MKTFMQTIIAVMMIAVLASSAQAQDVLSSAHSVYFGSGSSILTAKAKITLTELVARIKKGEGMLQDVVVYGYASKEGGVTYNLKLSERRIDVVYNFLKDQGIPEEKLIKKVPRGEEQARSKWYKGEPEPEGAKARFVEVIVTPSINRLDPVKPATPANGN